METMYFVSRIFFNKESGQQSQSIQAFYGLGSDKANETAARKRYYNVLAADIDSDNYSYEQVMLYESNGLVLFNQVFDNRVEPETEEE